MEREVDLALARARRPAALDVDDVGAVQDGHVDGAACLVGELLEVRRGDLPELHGVDRREAEVEHPRSEPVLPRLRVLLQVAETGERGDVAVRRAAAQAESAGEIADPALGRFGPELCQDCETALERLRAADTGRCHVLNTKTVS